METIKLSEIYSINGVEKRKVSAIGGNSDVEESPKNEGSGTEGEI